MKETEKRLPESNSNWKRTVILTLAYAVSLASLVWTLRDTNLSRLASDIAQLHPGWTALAVASMLSVYWVQGIRWSLIVTPVTKLPVLAATRAIFVGLFASELFPLRAGEVIRCYLVSRWTSLPFSVSVASVLIERVFDGLLMWVGIRFALRSVRMPRVEQIAVDGLGVFVIAGVVIMGIALFRPKLRHAEMPKSGWRKRWFVLQEDLALIGHSGYLWASLAASVPYMLLQVVTIYIVMEQYHFGLSFGVAIALTMLLRLAAALPQAPATLGMYQLVTREFLQIGFGVASDEAARFSLVLWAVAKLPLLISGAIAVAITGSKIGELTKAATEARQTSSR
jgi:hypothetical protein